MFQNGSLVETTFQQSHTVICAFPKEQGITLPCMEHSVFLRRLIEDQVEFHSPVRSGEASIVVVERRK